MYHYECKHSRFNICASYIQESSSFIISNGYNWKVRYYFNYHIINVSNFLLCNSCGANAKYSGRTVHFGHRINIHVTVCCYGTFTNKVHSHAFKCSNKKEHVAKKPYFKVYLFVTVNNENELLCYECYLHEMLFDTMYCSSIQYGGISTFCPPGVFLGLGILAHFSTKIRSQKLLKFIKIVNYSKSPCIIF